MELEFEIKNQKLNRIGKTEIANYSVNYIVCDFTFKTTDWQNVEKYVLFKSEKGKVFCYSLGTGCTGTCAVPAKVMEHDFFKMTVFGVDGDERITTNELTLKLVRSGFTGDFEPYDPEESGDVFTEWRSDVYLSIADAARTYVPLEEGKGLFSGSYTDLSDKPSIPDSISDLIDDSSFISMSDTVGLVKNDGTIDTSTYSVDGHTHTSLAETSAIPASADLNSETYTVEGIYSVSGTNSSTLTNKPSDAGNGGGRVEVKSYVSGTAYRFVQFYYEFRDGAVKVYYRYGRKSSTVALTWYAWKLVANTGDIVTDVSGLTDSNGVIPVDVSDLTDTENTAFTPKSHTHSEYVNPTIADNLTTNDSTQVLSAKQGKALADLIGDAITYINQ